MECEGVKWFHLAQNRFSDVDGNEWWVLWQAEQLLASQEGPCSIELIRICMSEECIFDACFHTAYW